MALQVEYFCPSCETNFVVHHASGERNKHCCWCGGEVKQTGKVTRIEGSFCVEYQDDKEINAYLRCDQFPYKLNSEELLKEIEKRIYIAGCVDDGVSDELKRLWKERDRIHD